MNVHGEIVLNMKSSLVYVLLQGSQFSLCGHKGIIIVTTRIDANERLKESLCPAEEVSSHYAKSCGIDIEIFNFTNLALLHIEALHCSNKSHELNLFFPGRKLCDKEKLYFSFGSVENLRHVEAVSEGEPDMKLEGENLWHKYVLQLQNYSCTVIKKPFERNRNY